MKSVQVEISKVENGYVVVVSEKTYVFVDFGSFSTWLQQQVG